MIWFSFLPLIIYIPAGIYFYFLFRRFLTLFHLEKRTKLTKILSVLFALLLVAAGWKAFRLGGVLVLHFLLCSLVLEVVNQILRRVLKEGRGSRIWDKLFKSCIISVLITAAFIGYGWVNMQQIRETDYTIQTEKTLEGNLRIAQISDLHMGTTMGLEELRSYCKNIQEKTPDLFVLTGDIFDESTEKSQMEEAAALLGSVEARYGTYYIWGNHDPNHYVSQPNYSMEEIQNALGKNGIRVLEDEALQVTPQLALVGRVDSSISENRKSIQELLSGIDKNSYIIVLDHRPVLLEENAAQGVDLQLSGHTHAGQIWPTGQLALLLGINEQNYGEKAIGDFHAIVSSGIGGWGYAIRTGGHSEYVMIDVK